MLHIFVYRCLEGESWTSVCFKQVWTQYFVWHIVIETLNIIFSIKKINYKKQMYIVFYLKNYLNTCNIKKKPWYGIGNADPALGQTQIKGKVEQVYITNKCGHSILVDTL
jgi:hypothetical protein